MTRGYELDSTAKQAQTRASQSAVELERAAARQQANQERIAELEARAAAGAAELEQAKQHLANLTVERDAHRSFLETAAAEAANFRQQAKIRQQQARDAVAAVTAAEQRAEAGRRQAMQLISQLGLIRNQAAQAEESLASLERDATGWRRRWRSAKRDLEALGAERGQLSMNFESVTETLKRLEAEIASLRAEIAARRTEETEAKRRGDQLRAEHATLTGRRNSLNALIREHSYSTDTVRKLFRSDSLGGGLAPVGTLADFLEVNDQYESVVDEFLRDELNYIVVKSWDAANEGMRLLKTDVDGRATFLVHPEDSQAKFSFAAGSAPPSYQQQQGVVRLKECIRVLDGFGSSLEVILPKLREGYVTHDSETARALALENPHAFFLAPSGECFHNVTVTGGKPRAEGPLALKRELRETQQKLETVERDLSQAELTVATLIQDSRRTHSTARREKRGPPQRRARKREPVSGAAPDGFRSSATRTPPAGMDPGKRTQQGRARRQADFIEQKREEAQRLEAQHRSCRSRP